MKALFLGIVLSLSVTAIAGSRETKIDFEDALVEGVNKQPLDSLSQLSDDSASRKYRLYRKRGGYKDLHDALLLEMRNSQ
ncbi:hypothetical protein GW915_12530 [bacterium]|nr:hypothetical protein [bacterium]